MAKYTTGEAAKLCGVTVRTVQYYDTRSILTPSALSEGGRRLYVEEDIARLKVICFLRELNIPIRSIGELLKEENPESVIWLILNEQAQTLQGEIADLQGKLETLEGLQQALKRIEPLTMASIGAMARTVTHRRKIKKVHTVMLITGIPLNVLQWISLYVWIRQGQWWLFAVWAVTALLYALWVSHYYFTRAAFICPQCYTVFQPAKREALWAKHTPHTRKLTCVACGYHGFCAETHREEMIDG